MKAIKINRDEANQIIAYHQDKPMEQVVICYQAQWYDIRGMTYEERQAFIQTLINKDTKVMNIQFNKTGWKEDGTGGTFIPKVYRNK